jgi:AraC family transcriptional regulator
MSLRVEQLPRMRVAYIHHAGPFHQIVDAFSLLMEWAALADVDVAEEQVLVVASDDPFLGHGERTAYDAAITVKEDAQGTAVVGIEEIGGGEYALVEVSGGYDDIATAFAAAAGSAADAGRGIASGPAIVFFREQSGSGQDASISADVYVPLAEARG